MPLAQLRAASSFPGPMMKDYPRYVRIAVEVFARKTQRDLFRIAARHRNRIILVALEAEGLGISGGHCESDIDMIIDIAVSDMVEIILEEKHAARKAR